jgi:hypothetical protein
MKNTKQAKGNSRAIQRLFSESVREEIATFFRAIDSYPASFSKNHGLTFNRYLCNLLQPSASDRQVRRPKISSAQES